MCAAQLDVEESMSIGGLKTAVEEARSISRDSLKLVYKQVHGRCMHGCMCCIRAQTAAMADS